MKPGDVGAGAPPRRGGQLSSAADVDVPCVFFRYTPRPCRRRRCRRVDGLFQPYQSASGDASSRDPTRSACRHGPARISGGPCSRSTCPGTSTASSHFAGGRRDISQRAQRPGQFRGPQRARTYPPRTAALLRRKRSPPSLSRDVSAFAAASVFPATVASARRSNPARSAWPFASPAQRQFRSSTSVFAAAGTFRGALLLAVET